jgi:hypothetical protein
MDERTRGGLRYLALLVAVLIAIATYLVVNERYPVYESVMFGTLIAVLSAQSSPAVMAGSRCGEDRTDP